VTERSVQKHDEQIIDGLRDSHALSKLVGASSSFVRAIAPIESLARAMRRS